MKENYPSEEKINGLIERVKLIEKKTEFLFDFHNEELKPFMVNVATEVSTMKEENSILKGNHEQMLKAVESIKKNITIKTYKDYLLILLIIFIFMYIMIILLI